MTMSGIDRDAWVKSQGGGLDPRTTLARPDLAFEGLKGKVEAGRFAPGRTLTVQTPVANLKNEPRSSAGLLTQALLGETIRVLDTHSGWAFCQLMGDGYVGYLEEKNLAGHFPTPNARVNVPLSHIYPLPDLKTPPRMAVPFGAKVCANLTDSREGFSEVKGQGWIFTKHLVDLSDKSRDVISTAKTFLNCPYLWGGKSALGLDCSALVQLSLMVVGLSCPRDTDQQQKLVGHSISNVPDIGIAKEGDLIFFPGHVGFLVGDDLLLHANATHMRVTFDKVKDVITWVQKTQGAGISDIRRLKVGV